MSEIIYDRMKNQGWFKFGSSELVNNRTVEQKAWDSAILAAAEYVRRRTKNEAFALEIHDLLTWKSKDHPEDSRNMVQEGGKV